MMYSFEIDFKAVNLLINPALMIDLLNKGTNLAVIVLKAGGWGVCETHLHQVYKPYAIGAMAKHILGNEWW